MWDYVSLEQLLAAPIRNGLTKPSRIRGTGVKMISMGEIFSYDRIGDLPMERVPVTEGELESSNIESGDLLFARQSLVLEGAGKCSIVTDVNEPTVFESHLIRVRIDKEKALPHFIYYYFKSNEGRGRIRGIVEQVAAAGIRGKDLIKLLVPCPPLDVQEAIVANLQQLDELALINRRANDYLLQLCATRYDEARREIAVNDDASEQAVLTDLIEVCYGKDHKKLADGEYPVYGSGGLMRHVENYLHEGESVLIPRKGTLNNVMVVHGRFWTVDTMFYTKELFAGAARYAYFILAKLDLASMNAGSAVPSMTTKMLSAIPVLQPSPTKLAELESWSDPLFEQIRLNERENERLETLRDTLLPKLMSSEIDVSATSSEQLVV